MKTITFPLVRVRWSNEHIMALVFISICLYHLPRWFENPQGIITFLFLVIVGLFIDTIINFIRYKQMVCSVSAAVTAGILSLFIADISVLGQLLSLAAALLLGKHVFGGTGKNILNPAITGLFVILLIYDIPYPFFDDSLLVLPGLIVSLGFLFLRPFAGLGYLSGMIVSFVISESLTLENILAYGMFFWACIILTDPVTVTANPVTGYILSFGAGFAALYYNDPVILTMGILIFNIISCLTQDIIIKGNMKTSPKLRIKKKVPYIKEKTLVIDLTGEIQSAINDEIDLSKDEILNRISANEVYGMGGAGFPAFQKIMAAAKADADSKYLIVNGVECDPGLIHDKWLLHNCRKEIIKGIQLIMKCVDFNEVILAVKDSEGLDFAGNIKMMKIHDFYPAGAERILIENVLHKKIEKNIIPAECGILILNVQTIYAVYHSVYENKRSDTRFITAANLKEHKATVVKVKTGTKIKDILDAVFPEEINAFAGGGVMQSYVVNDDSVVDKTVNFISAAQFPKYKESPQCSKCGICKKNCPAGLQVNRIADLVDKGDLKNAKKFMADKCIECGSCSYSCLAGRNLSFRVKTAKES